MKENEELQVKNQFLIDILYSTTCSQYKGPVLHPDVQRSGKEVVPSHLELLLTLFDGPIDKDFWMGGVSCQH